jgi:cell division protease FtsH
VEQEITRIITEQYDRARKIVEDNRDKLEVMTQKLLEWETLESDQIEQIMKGEAPRPPEEEKTPSNPSDGGTVESDLGESELSEEDIDLADPNETV